MQIVINDLQTGKKIVKEQRDLAHFNIQLKNKRSYYPTKFSRKTKHKGKEWD